MSLLLSDVFTYLVVDLNDIATFKTPQFASGTKQDLVFRSLWNIHSTNKDISNSRAHGMGLEDVVEEARDDIMEDTS